LQNQPLGVIVSTFPKHKAVVVGSGHNGLTAAIILAQNSWEVEVFEKSYTFGGSTRSVSAFGMGEIVDFGAASHPFVFRSPIFKK